MRRQLVTWGKAFRFLVGALVTTAILIALSYIAMGAEVGTGALLNVSATTMERWRQKWFDNFVSIHFALQGVMLYAFNLIKRRRGEVVYTDWPVEGIDQLFSVMKLFVGIVLMEVLSYLLQFLGNATYVAVTNWLSEITVENKISVMYLTERIDILVILWESLIAALILSFADRMKRKARATRRREAQREAYEQQRREEAQRAYQKQERQRKNNRVIYDEVVSPKPQQTIMLPGNTEQKKEE